MTDIVTRLRNKRTEFDNWLNDIEGKHSFGHDESIWLDAADEIERLRADRDRWRALAEYLCQNAPSVVVPDEIACQFPNPLVVRGE